MSPRRLLLLLAPLLLASLPFAVRARVRPAPSAERPPGEPQALPGPPAVLSALPLAGRWELVETESSLRLAVLDGARNSACGAESLRGALVLEQDGRLTDLDVDARLCSAGAKAMPGSVGEARVSLRAVACRSVPGAVPGSRTAAVEAWLSFDGRRRALVVRAAWMPCGPGRLRLQLEAGWAGNPAGDDDALCTLLCGRRTSTLALDLVLARS